MNVLVYLCDKGTECIDMLNLSLAIEEYKKGNNIFILNCDSSIGMCDRNPNKNCAFCKACELIRKYNIKKFAPKDVEVHQMREYSKIIDKTKLPKLQYNNAEELRALTYKGIDIGFGVMSTYISKTRNLNPKITDESRKYFDAEIEAQLYSLAVIEMLQEQNHFELMIFYNGRNIKEKAFLNFCQREGIDFWCTESRRDKDGRQFIDNYWNTIPHDMTTRGKKILECWNEAPEPLEERKLIAKSFYENRRNAKPAGDKIYTANQVVGEMPKDWNNNIENIVIFNSSEDEFCAVSHEYDEEAVFKYQIEGIKAIAEHYKDDKTKMFTLRVHPNLMNIPYKYHTDLYKLDFPNLRIIPGNSSVSTYSLMDAADKIIVFGSTTGIESVYWRKPVICLAGALYRDLDVVYKPKNINELWQFIEQKDLACKYNDNVLAYGYYIMQGKLDLCKNFDIDLYLKIIFGRHIRGYACAKMLGSKFIYGFVVAILEETAKRLNHFKQFKTIPTEEA